MTLRLLTFGDSGQPSGYGRIHDEIATRLHKRGYHILAASIQYDGLLPPHYEGTPLPYWVASLGGRTDWLDRFVGIIHAYSPDVVLTIQDMPYHQAIYNAPVDWSKHTRVLISPVDGAPIAPDWLRTLEDADAALTISQFGVEAFRQSGHSVDLCPPGVDSNIFYRLPDDQRAALRDKLQIPRDAFVLGAMAQNQGRKSISLMLKGFFEFAKGRDAYYLLDMEPTSPVGWNIPALCQQYGWDIKRLIFRADAVRAGLVHLRDRYNLLDAHAVISHREGFGLPLLESLSCGVVSMALDWCSGREVVGLPEEGRGVLVKAIDYDLPSTWGGSIDKFVDLDDFIAQLTRLYDQPTYRQSLADAGMVWARTRSWDAAADAVQSAITRALAQRATWTTMPVMETL